MSQQDYIKLQKAAIQALGLHDAVVYCYLLDKADENGEVEVNYNEIEEQTKITWYIAKKAISKLLALGIISFESVMTKNVKKAKVRQYNWGEILDISVSKNSKTKPNSVSQNSNTDNVLVFENSNTEINSVSKNSNTEPVIINKNNQVVELDNININNITTTTPPTTIIGGVGGENILVGNHPIKALYNDLKKDVLDTTMQCGEEWMRQLKCQSREQCVSLLDAFMAMLIMENERQQLSRTLFRNRFRGWAIHQNKVNERPKLTGVDEFFNEQGQRTYGTGKVIVPMSARPRPSRNAWWDRHNNEWNTAGC